MSTITSSVNSATANAQSQVQQAAQSIISGSTGNSSMDLSTLVSALINAKTAGQATARTGGIIDTRNNALNADLKSVTAQQSKLSDYATQLTKQYQSQFTALNTLMATMNNNSAYLTALFGGAQSAGALATNK